MKTTIFAFSIAMDEFGCLWVATRGPQGGPQFWERIPLYGAGMLRYPPLNAYITGQLQPEWAIDSYILTQAEAESLASAA